MTGCENEYKNKYKNDEKAAAKWISFRGGLFAQNCIFKKHL